MTSSLHSLPVELVYRILDHLEMKNIFLSCREVCKRLNDIIDSYHPYQTTIILYLHHKQIGGEGAKHVANVLKINKTLTELHLNYNKIGDQGALHLADALQENETLTELYLQHNGIGPEGAYYLANVLRRNKTLTRLNLDHNHIGSQGTEYLANALVENNTLYALFLYYNQIGEQGAQHLVNLLKQNKDGRLDIVVANYGTSTIGILYGYGNGSFGNIQTYSTGFGSKPIAISVADLNNDNLLDIIVGDGVSYKLGLFFGYSDGTYTSMSPVDLQPGISVYSLSIVDLNNDSRLDVIIPDDANYNIEVFLASGSEPFGGQTIFSTGNGSNPSFVGVTDFNNDNHLDIVTANSGTNNIGILFGYGNRLFSNISTYSTGNNSQPLSLAIGDFNNDSRTDIVVANSNTDNIVIFIGDGNGNFSLFKIYPMGSNARPVSVTVAYLNKDSQLDIIVANYGTNNVCFLFGSGDGTFTNETYHPLGYDSRPNWAVAKDLNNDDRQDIAVVTTGINNIKVLLNIC